MDLSVSGGSNPYVIGNPQPELNDNMFSPVEVNLIHFEEMKGKSPTKTKLQIQKQIILEKRLRIQRSGESLKVFQESDPYVSVPFSLHSTGVH